MNARSVVLAICCLLFAAVFTIVYLAKQDTYELFTGGEHVAGTVVRVSKNDPPLLRVRYTGADGKTEEDTSEMTSGANAQLQPGDPVEILRHRNVPSRIALADAVEASKPSPLLFAGTAVFVLLGGYVLFLPRLRAARRARRTSGLDVITDSLRRTRAVNLAVGGGIAAFGAFMVWLAATGADRTATRGTNIGIGIFGGFTALLGLFMLSRVWGLRSIRGSEILRTIEETPQEIAWIYEQVVQTRGAGEISAQSFIYVWFASGKSYTISVEREDARLLLDELVRRAPHARVGYDQEIEKLYREKPDRFRP